MNSGFLRWLKVVLFGSALGLFFVLANLILWSFFPSANPLRHVQSGPPFRLSAGPVKQQLLFVIGSQLSAFRRDDYPAAYAFADSAMRSQISPATFEHLVKTSYPAIARSHAASFGIILDNGFEALVNVRITTRSGRNLRYRYFLHRESSGWKISGVIRVQAEGTTA